METENIHLVSVKPAKVRPPETNSHYLYAKQKCHRPEDVFLCWSINPPCHRSHFTSADSCSPRFRLPRLWTPFCCQLSAESLTEVSGPLELQVSLIRVIKAAVHLVAGSRESPASSRVAKLQSKSSTAFFFTALEKLPSALKMINCP